MRVSLQEPQQWEQQKLGQKGLINAPCSQPFQGQSGKKEDRLIFLLLMGFNKCLHKLENKHWF